MLEIEATQQMLETWRLFGPTSELGGRFSAELQRLPLTVLTTKNQVTVFFYCFTS